MFISSLFVEGFLMKSKTEKAGLIDVARSCVVLLLVNGFVVELLCGEKTRH